MGRLLAVHARNREDEAPCRVAVLASRRVGNAVRRNRAKRLLREAEQRIAWARGWDVVLAGRAAAPGAKMAAVLAEAAELAQELDLVVEHPDG